MTTNTFVAADPESTQFLARMAEQERYRNNRHAGVRTVLIVLSAAGMVYDVESLRQKVLLSYPGTTTYFMTTCGKSIGAVAPAHVDLLIDFTGPKQRQGLFFSRKLRRGARLAVGRNAGWFRKSIYDRVFDEKVRAGELPKEMLARERAVQKEVMALAGVAMVPMGDTPPDRGKITPMELPPFAKLRVKGRGVTESSQLSSLGRAAERLFDLLCSLKLAVLIILVLAIALTTGTVLESVYDTPTSQYYVYRSLWFHGVLALLGINIFCVAVSRWPWQKKHVPFLLAHLGILMLLAGSWMTQKFGLDGSMRVAEGETSSVVEMEDSSLVLSKGNQLKRIPVQWIPPTVSFQPRKLDTADTLGFDIVMDRYISHADPKYSFVQAAVGGANPRPAVHLKLTGGPMNITQDLWMWAGDPSFRMIQMGPSRFSLGPTALDPIAGRPDLSLIPQPSGLTIRSHTSDGKVSEFKLEASKVKDYMFDPGWKGGLKITILEWLPDAIANTTYTPARVQFGMGAPPAAIHLTATAGGGPDVWLGLGDRAVLSTPQGDAEVGFMPQRVILPYAVRLDRFKVERYEGSLDPSEYWSQVTVDPGVNPNGSSEGAFSKKISMNEPLTHKGVTFYQASYEDASPRPVVSIFSVNRDPGRSWKYWGSILLVVGSIMLFAVKYRSKTRARGVMRPSESQEVL